MFGLWVKDLAIFDLEIRFFVKNCEYRPNFVKNALRGAENMKCTLFLSFKCFQHCFL